MFAAIRTYSVTDTDELSAIVKEGFLPIVETVPGFVAYYVVDAGNGVASSITICEERPVSWSRRRARPSGSRRTSSTSSSPDRPSSRGPSRQRRRTRPWRPEGSSPG